MAFSIVASVAASVAVVIVYGIGLVFYRLVFHPLAGFPGPCLAAATWWYEFYHDTRLGGGLYIWRIEDLHKKYGPVVRINPEELHIIDTEFHEVIYAGATSARDKWDLAEKSAQSFGATGHTPSHKLHRIRKDSLSPFFSKRTVAEREPQIREKVDHLVSRIHEYAGKNRPVNLTVAYIALCMDIITEYAFGKEYGLLADDDFNEQWKNTIMSIVSSVAVLTHLPWIPALMRSLPESVQKILSPDVAQLLEYEHRIREKIQSVLNVNPSLKSEKLSGKSTIFDVVRDNPKLPDSEKKLQRMSDEGNVLLIAATETPGKVLALLTYHLLADPIKLARLRSELESIGPKPSLRELESLPYLVAVVKEGLRLHGGVVTRSKRIAPYDALKCGKYTIPPGTPMSCSIYFMHYDQSLFPEPFEFRPDRWIDADEATKKLMERQFAPFGRGTRNCLGYNLGMAEVYMTIAAVITKFDMEPYKTTRKDVDLERDWLIPQPSKDSKGVQVLVTAARGE
ncbi:cytochrome P450 [Talaromyces proteolyticus]|uniref:Cytochrome P450 n=1 Tax=Talaromyces proteolyticus TaxID=1131652 RepID=A0AAD4KQA9_9EURO|nr:cytochrome P450 [Talaromyces proteolyticus]KAH8694203.1 cytochrome P450 [Talaromyces proteolyticus]